MNMKRSIRSLILQLVSVSVCVITMSGCGTVPIADSSQNLVLPDEGKDEFDMETFVSELIRNEYSNCYETFDAVCKLDNEKEVRGLAFSDYALFLESENSEDGYFPSGFIPYFEEAPVSSEEVVRGVEVVNQNFEHEKYGFVLAYNVESFMRHCVVDGKYVKYGVNSSGSMTYTAIPYAEESIAEELGPLYSYDEQCFLYDPNVGLNTPVTGVPLSVAVDYSSLQDEIDRILSEQDNNFTTFEINTVSYYSKEALISNLLASQRETFLGVDVAELIDAAETADMNQYIAVSPNGHITMNLGNGIPEDITERINWTIAVSWAISMICNYAIKTYFPAAERILKPIIKTAVKVFVEYVLINPDNKKLDWKTLAVIAVSEAIPVWLCPLAKQIIPVHANTPAETTLQKLANYGIKIFPNSLTKGAADAAIAAIDGEGDDLDTFFAGAAISASCGIAMDALNEVGERAEETIRHTVPNSWLTNLNNKTESFVRDQPIVISSGSIEETLSKKTEYEVAYAVASEMSEQGGFAD